jgi:hypothetical protein
MLLLGLLGRYTSAEKKKKTALWTGPESNWRHTAFQVGPNFNIILNSNDFMHPKCRIVRIKARVTTNGCHVTSVAKLVDYVGNIQIWNVMCNGFLACRRHVVMTLY